jgi:hypothetical protein
MLGDGGDDVRGAADIGRVRLLGEALADRDLLQRRGVEHEVDPAQGAEHRAAIAHIPDAQLEGDRLPAPALLLPAQLALESGLLLLIAGEAHDPRRPPVGARQGAPEQRAPEGAGAAGDEDAAIGEHAGVPSEVDS